MTGGWGWGMFLSWALLVPKRRSLEFTPGKGAGLQESEGTRFHKVAVVLSALGGGGGRKDGREKGVRLE